MGRLAALLVVLAGCDSLFNLDTVPLPPGSDAGGSDALVPEPDVASCTPDQKTLALAGITAIAAGDLDRSGTSDLAITSTQDPNGDVVIYLGNVTRSLTSMPPFHPGANPVAVAWYARTAAAFPDLIVSVRGTSTVVELPNTSGTLGVPAAIGTAAVTSGLAIGNFNGDAFSDVIAATDTDLAVYIGAAAGFSGTGSIGLANVQSIVAGQLSAEPADDFAASRPLTKETDVVFGSTTGTVSNTPLAMGAATAGVAIGDFTGDHIPDVATALPTGALVVAPGPTFAGRTSTTFSAPGPLLALEMTGDDHLDLIVGTPTGVFLVPSNGDGTFGTPLLLLATPSAVIALASGDFDGDGHTDIAAATGSAVTVLFECQ